MLSSGKEGIFKKIVRHIRFLSVSVRKLLCLFSPIRCVKGLCFRGVCALEPEPIAVSNPEQGESLWDLNPKSIGRYPYPKRFKSNYGPGGI